MNPALLQQGRKHSQNPAKTVLQHAQVIMYDGQNGWFQHITFSSKLQTLPNFCPAWPGLHLSSTSPEQSYSLPFQGGDYLQHILYPLELQRPIFHLVLRRCSITTHSQQPFMNNFGPFLTSVRNFMTDWCYTFTKSTFTHEQFDLCCGQVESIEWSELNCTHNMPPVNNPFGPNHTTPCKRYSGWTVSIQTMWYYIVSPRF